MKLPSSSKLAYVLLTSVVTFVAANTAYAADIYVIVHPGTKVSESDVKEIFLGDKQFAEGVKLVPVDNAAVQGDMSAKVLNLDPARYNAVWVKKSFRLGLNPPAVKSSDVEVVEFVKKTVGAIGYVSVAQPAGVTVVRKY